MNYDEIRQLADEIDKDELWRLGALSEEFAALTPEQSRELWAGVLLRRHADEVRDRATCPVLWVLFTQDDVPVFVARSRGECATYLARVPIMDATIRRVEVRSSWAAENTCTEGRL